MDMLQTFLRKKKRMGRFQTVMPKTNGHFMINWFGGEPFGGREVVFYKHKPYWMMAYYGSDSQTDEGTIPFLRKALSQMPEDMPVRGPKELIDGKYRYVNTWLGTLGKFIGEEKIYFEDKEVFKTNYSGGVVDQING